ncbi:MAG TPA: S8 family serine peptidase, partial [Gammaproteobacteria bacterium]
GVAPDTRLFSLEACWSAADAPAVCDSFTLAKAMSWAIREGLEVINLSLAGPEDPLLGRLIEAALNRGISVVAADDAREGLSFPASVPGVIAVRAAENYDDSARQTGIFYAPGRDVMTTVPRGAYDFVSGSSMAAAHVSGLVALVRAYDPSLSGDGIQTLLRQTFSAEQRNRQSPVHVSIDACSLLLAAGPKRNGVDNCTPPVLVAR